MPSVSVVPTFDWTVIFADSAGRPTPVPLRLIVWGLPRALSEMVMAPVRVPSALGANPTLIAQLPPGDTLLAQLFVCVKSPLMVPLVKFSGAFPVLLRVTG